MLQNAYSLPRLRTFAKNPGFDRGLKHESIDECQAFSERDLVSFQAEVIERVYNFVRIRILSTFNVGFVQPIDFAIEYSNLLLGICFIKETPGY